MLRLHVRKESLLEVHLPTIPRRATGTFALALVVLVDVESPSDLLAASVKVGLQVLVELGVGVDQILRLKRHGAVESALDAC